MKRTWIRIAGRVSALTVALALGLATTTVTPAGAGQLVSASPSPFCSTLFAFHPKAPVNSKNWSAYRAFAKSVLPTFEKLAATAPNAGTKEVMTQLVDYLKFDVFAKSLPSYAKYWQTHITNWEHDWQQFALAEMACVKNL